MSSLETRLSAKGIEQLIGDFLNTQVIDIFCYGLYMMVFARTIVARGEWPVQRVMLTVVVCMIWAFATTYAVLVWVAFYSTFVTHGQSTHSVLSHMFGQDDWSWRRLAMNIVRRTLTVLNAFLAELVNTWRCWVLYDRNWIVGVLPLLSIICGLISHALKMVTLFPSGSTTTSSLANTEWLIVCYAVTTSTNILTTSLLIYRILSVGGLKNARTYGGIIKILVESAFLFSATYVVYLAVFVRDYYVPYLSFTNWYFEALLNAVTAAAPTLIIGRVMAGEARFNDSWLNTTLPQSTGIRFATMHPAQTSATIDLLPRCENDLASDTSTPVNTGDASAVDVEKGIQLGSN